MFWEITKRFGFYYNDSDDNDVHKNLMFDVITGIKTIHNVIYGSHMVILKLARVAGGIV